MRLGLGLGLSRSGVSSGGGGGPSPSYTFLGENGSAASGNVHTFAVDIGTASAVRYILLTATVQNADPVPVSVTVAGVGLALLANSSTAIGFMNVLYGGLVTTGDGVQNAVVTWTSASFENKRMALWSLLNLASTTPKAVGSQTAGATSIPVTVDVGDLVFLGVSNPGPTATNANTSTPAPNRQSEVGSNLYSADWLITASGTLTMNFIAASAQRTYASFA